MKKILSTICLLACVWMAHAGAAEFSYLYIQGDKQTPFYVKLEDAMQPRFGKNYCIIPKLAPGPAHIELLFQQNIYPAQKFTVLIPEGGSRGFLLVRSEANKFLLYDLQQGFYLPAGNKAEDDHLPPAVGQTEVQAADYPGEQVHEVPAEDVGKKQDISPKAAAVINSQERTQKPPAKEDKPVFIEDLSISRGAGKDSDLGAQKVTSVSPTATPLIINTDCPTPISTTEFGRIFTAISRFSADEDKLEYFYGKLDQCYETWQARTLAGKLSGDAARYELLRKIYPRITDQAAFPLLDDLLTTEIWKAEFNRLVRH